MHLASVPTIVFTAPQPGTVAATETTVLPGLEGTYNVKGIAPDGKDYLRKLTISLNSRCSSERAIYRLSWDNGSSGAGFLIKDARTTVFLAAGFGGSICEVVFYSIDPTTIALRGTRLWLGTLQITSELASPTAKRETLEGDYNLIGLDYSEKIYQGTLSITQPGMENVWQMVWKIGQPFTGIGISINKSLFAAASGGAGCGVAVYEANPDGSLHATWTEWGDQQVGEETATK